MTTPNIPAEPTIPSENTQTSENPPNEKTSALETFYLTVPFISLLLGIVLGLLS